MYSYNSVVLKELEINHIIALCNIIDDYESFYQSIKKEIPIKDRFRFLKDLERCSKGKRFMILKAVKRICNDNKKVIDIINKYDSFYYFIFCNYLFASTGIEESEEFKLIREYIEKNKEHINEIITLLEKLKELGFETLKFDEKEDFSKKEYSISKTTFSHVFNFMNNIEILPRYDTDVIHYKTSNSPYRIAMTSDWGSAFSSKSIVLNSLVFDISELPNSLSKEDTYDKIIELSKDMEQVNNAIRNSVSLESGISGLEESYQTLCEIVGEIQNGDTTFVSSRENVGQILSQISECIKDLQKESIEYDKSAISKHPKLSQKLLKREKKRYREMKGYMQNHLD